MSQSLDHYNGQKEILDELNTVMVNALKSNNMGQKLTDVLAVYNEIALWLHMKKAYVGQLRTREMDSIAQAFSKPQDPSDGFLYIVVDNTKH